MFRFAALALPLTILLLAGASFVERAAGLEPDRAPLSRLGVARAASSSPGLATAALVFESLALVAAALLVFGRTGRLWLDGLAAGLLAWLFRGPLLVASVESLTRLPQAPFAELARNALVTYAVVGLVLAALAHATGLER